MDERRHRCAEQVDLVEGSCSTSRPTSKFPHHQADALWDTGIEFGTVGVGKGDHRLEITTFRADRYDQVSRNPQVCFGERLEDDLVRRDFTVNAMAVRITPTGPGEFLDPLGGLAALRDGVLDTPASPSDPDGDGRVDDRLFDTDGNGVADRAMLASDTGGYDTAYVDGDGDGRWDVKLADSNGDGTADAASVLNP